MKKGLLFSLVASSILSLWFCQKKVFKHIAVTGRLIHFFTKEPLSGIVVQLGADDATSSKDSRVNTIVLKTTTSDSEGKFKLRSSASRSNNYYIGVRGDEATKWAVRSFKKELTEKGVNEMGDILVGVKTFFCKVKITLSSSANTSVQFDQSAEVFAPGSQSEVLLNHTYEKEDFLQAAGNFVVRYKTTTNGLTSFSSFNVPFTQSDTVYTSIQY